MDYFLSKMKKIVDKTIKIFVRPNLVEAAEIARAFALSRHHIEWFQIS